jgi:hypothetical protein
MTGFLLVQLVQLVAGFKFTTVLFLTVFFYFQFSPEDM